MRKVIYGAFVAILVVIDAALIMRGRWRRHSHLASSHLTESTSSTTATPTAGPAQVAPPAAPPAPSPTPHAAHPARYSLRAWPLSLDATLFASALLVFVLTRVIGLDRWPIYFFTDEAIQTVQAANLIGHGFRDASGQLLPTYFENGLYLNLSLSVYAQVLPFWLFGYSVAVTRGVSVLVALSGAAAVGLMLRDIFKVRFWWIGTLLLSVTPAFFLHSRTAFETVFGASLYAWFLYFYLRYRTLKPHNLYGAVLFGALTFYSYSPMQVIVVATGLLLILSDLRYHLQNWRTVAAGLLLLVVCALPYLRFQAAHPDETWLHLRILNSYLLDPVKTAADKLADLRTQYLLGLSPAYWFDRQTGPDLIRHVMKGYGHLPLFALPFIAIGLFVCVRNFKSSPYRAILIALLVTPLGGALTQIQIYRVLALLVPATLLTSIGVILILTWLLKHLAYRTLAIGTFAVLAIVNGAMLDDALRNGATWYTDYTLGGMQWGGQQIFEEARQALQHAPDTQVIISPTWANGADILLWFFLPNEARVRMGNIEAYQFSKLDLNDRLLLVMTAAEYQRAIADPKFADIRVENTLKYPDGSDGFYFVRLKYSPQADQIFAAEDAARRKPVREEVTIDGQSVSVLHSQLDVGEIKNVFDGDTHTLARALVDNPFIIELTFPQPRQLNGLTLTTATMDFNLLIKAFVDEQAEPIVSARDFVNQGPDPTVDLPFDSAPAQPTKKLRIEVKQINAPPDPHLHIREVKLR